MCQPVLQSMVHSEKKYAQNLTDDASERKINHFELIPEVPLPLQTKHLPYWF